MLNKIRSYHVTRKARRILSLLASALFMLVVTAIMLETGQRTETVKVVSNAIHAIVLGPGIGEYTYETKLIKDNRGVPLNASRTDKSTPNIVDLVNNLQDSYPNLTKISLIVSWYAGSTNIAEAHLAPMVESKTGPDWQVGDYTRTTAEVTSPGTKAKPNSSGTPTDQSIIDLCLLLNKRGIAVTLYPNILIKDTDRHLQQTMTFQNEDDIKAFFDDYEKFIMHYAALEYKGKRLSENISAIIIASDMKLLTDYKNDQNEYVAVNQLIKLAAMVRNEVGSKVKISYAANWSEYHRTNDDWYNLDALWADKNIDFVGINAYFPITVNTPADKDISPEAVAQGWNNHEDNNSAVADQDLLPKPEIAIKNIEAWWKKPHQNPDGKMSSWRPKMKPIVFNEVGFTAIDHTSDDPAKSLGAYSKDKGLPNGSNGIVDPKFQYNAILGTIQFTESLFAQPDNEGILEGLFWYNIDPRGPSPDWIHNHELKVSDLEKGFFHKLQKLDAKDLEEFPEYEFFQSEQSVIDMFRSKLRKMMYSTSMGMLF